MGDTYWRLLDPYGTEIFETGFGNVSTFTLAVAGTYTLLVESDIEAMASGSCTFNVQFQDNTPPDPPIGTDLTLNAMVQGDIGAPGEVDRYTFSLASESQLSSIH